MRTKCIRLVTLTFALLLDRVQRTPEEGGLRGAPEADQRAGTRGARGLAAPMKRDAELSGYFEEAASWDADRIAQGRRTVRLALGVAGAGWLAVLALSGSLMLLMPLKQVEPFVVRVDNATGIVDVVPVYAGHVTMPEAVTRYFLAHYVTVCERFNYATAESDYEECGAFHTAQRNAGVVRALESHQPLIALESLQGRHERARADHIAELLQARERRQATSPRCAT